MPHEVNASCLFLREKVLFEVVISANVSVNGICWRTDTLFQPYVDTQIEVPTELISAQRLFSDSVVESECDVQVCSVLVEHFFGIDSALLNI